MKLFRPEAINGRKRAIYGNLLLTPKLSHSIITYGLLIWFALVFSWLLTTNYSKKETVFGWLEPPAGVIRIYPETVGVIERVLVQEGSNVHEGQSLLVIKTEALLTDGQQLSTKLLSEYESQQRLIRAQLEQADVSYQAKSDSLERKIAIAKKEQVILENQFETTAKRHQLAAKQVQRLLRFKEKGQISNSEIDSAIEAELALESEKQTIHRQRLSQQTALDQLIHEEALIAGELANTTAQLQEKLSDILQLMMQISSRSARVIKASRPGIVNNLQAREGQQVHPDKSAPLLTLLPIETQLGAHLLVPVRSAGFITEGQDLTIRYDAFPYQKFGLHEGRIKEISRTVLLPNEHLDAPISVDEPVYRISAEIYQSTINAYDSEFPLKPGMTLSADIKLSERTLMEWLLEPIYSLRGGM